MIHRRRPSSTVTLLVAVFLAISSLLPFWVGSEAGAAAPDTGDGQQAMAGHHHPVPGADIPDPSTPGSCVQHDTCDGKCCVGCGHCAVTTSEPHLPAVPFTPPSPTVLPVLLLSASLSGLDRPPRG